MPEQVFARRMDFIPFSGIRKVFEEVNAREKRGEKIIHLEIGRPDFDTPAHIKEEAKRHDLYVLADEIYEKMVYGNARHKSIASFPGMKERTITVNGFSKIYAMTGWRLGYAVADRALMKGLIRIHQYTTVCPCSFAQWGGVAALNGSQKEAEEMVAEFDRRRKLVSQVLRETHGISFVEPQGAFYVFPNIRAFKMTSEEMARYLLEEAKAAVVPGNVFGKYGEGHIRISYANSYENLKKAVINIRKALEKLT